MFENKVEGSQVYWSPSAYGDEYLVMERDERGLYEAVTYVAEHGTSRVANWFLCGDGSFDRDDVARYMVAYAELVGYTEYTDDDL